jgi:hypothetical protein
MSWCDGYRYVVSGLVELKHRKEFLRSLDTYTEVAHILPFALSSFNEESAPQVSKLGSFWRAG